MPLIPPTPDPIRYTIIDCPLGRLLVAAREGAVHTVGLGSNDEEIEAEFLRKRPHAARRDDDAQLNSLAALVLEVMDGRRPAEELPIDAPGTDFQWRIWRELMRIPYGATRTYGELARIVGSPNGARAVGRACATNPIAVVIPCHRAVGSDKSLTGFRWGLAHKARLLEYERARAEDQAKQASFLAADE